MNAADRREEPATPSARQRFLQFLMDELDAYDWEQSGALDVYLNHADAIERESLPAPLDVEWYHEAMYGVRGVKRHETCGCVAVAEVYGSLAAQPSTEPAQGEER